MKKNNKNKKQRRAKHKKNIKKDIKSKKISKNKHHRRKKFECERELEKWRREKEIKKILDSQKKSESFIQ